MINRLSILTCMVSNQDAPLHNIQALKALEYLTENGRGAIDMSQFGKKSKGKVIRREHQENHIQLPSAKPELIRASDK